MTAVGCIADDFTGGADVAAALRRAGLSVSLLFGVPPDESHIPESDAIVIALKTRTIDPDAAVRQSIEALSWLRERDVDTVYVKYCSTFDSTPRGNIGPVVDAVLEALGEQQSIICPASPEHGRRTYASHLFVDDVLLSDSSMRHHPLTPMTQSDLRRVLAPQTDGTVGSIPLSTVRSGPGEVARALRRAAAAGIRHVVVDVDDESDLDAIAAGAEGLRVLTGGAGLAGALGRRLAGSAVEPAPVRLPDGPALIVAGSCSAATLEQVAAAAKEFASLRLDPAQTPDPERLRAAATTWLRDHWGDSPLLVYSSAGPEDRARATAAMGPDTAKHLESILADVARTAAEQGAGRVVVAGGETSGAVTQALGVDSVVIEREAARGVPWCLPIGGGPALLLKSGNFGGEDLLVRAATEVTT